MTATAPDGIVHKLAEDKRTTLCGKNADGWSRHVTVLQLAGLALTCAVCGD